MIRWHRPALKFDLARVGVRLEDFLSGRISWNEAWELVSEILREPSSHVVSALNGDKYVPHPSERASWAVFELWVNAHKKKGAGYQRIPRPWDGQKPNYAVADTPEDEEARARRRARLAALF